MEVLVRAATSWDGVRHWQRVVQAAVVSGVEQNQVL